MRELDLIPSDYRAGLRRRRVIRCWVVAFAMINGFVIAGGAWLARDIGERRTLVARLQAENAITEQQQLLLQRTMEEQATYEQQLALLEGLRAGAAVEDIFSLIDQTIVEDRIWFLNWEFRRAGIVVDGESRTTETGYFIIVNDAASGEQSQGLEIETRMRIRGQATDHEALSGFVRALFEQPSVRDVDLQRTSSITIGALRAVEFNITIVLHSVHRES